MEEGGAHTTHSGSVYLSGEEFQKGHYDNSYWITSVLGHEASLKNGHKSESSYLKDHYTYIAHAGVYFEQGRTSIYSKLNEDEKSTVATGFTDRVWSAYVKGEITSTSLKTCIKAFNVENSGNVNINPSYKTDNNGKVFGLEYNISINGNQSPKQPATFINNPNQ